MQKTFQKLETLRKCLLGIFLLALMLELGGALLLFARHHTAGLITAFSGLLINVLITMFGRKRYENACALARAEFGMGIQKIEPIPQKAAASLPLPFNRLVPGAQAADRPLYLHALRGELNGLPLLLTEATIPYHPQGVNRRQYLVGTLASFDIPACDRDLLIFCGQPFGGSVRAEDYAAYRLLDTQGHSFHALSGNGSALTEGQSAALDAFCAGEEKDAVFAVEPGRLTVLFPSRFFSGSGKLNSPLPAAALQTSPVPGWERLPALARAMNK